MMFGLNVIYLSILNLHPVLICVFRCQDANPLVLAFHRFLNTKVRSTCTQDVESSVHPISWVIETSPTARTIVITQWDGCATEFLLDASGP